MPPMPCQQCGNVIEVPSTVCPRCGAHVAASQKSPPTQIKFQQVEFDKLVARGKLRRESVLILAEFARTGYVFHRNWGLGRVKEMNTFLFRILIDFENKRGHWMDLDFATKILEPATPEGSPADPSAQLEKLSWKLLPPGQLTVGNLKQYLRNAAYRQSKGPTFNVVRLEFLLNLSPVHVYAGLDEFDGYLAFMFPALRGALLENPIEGNAAYVFAENWRELSKLSKSELFEQARHQFRRIIHTGDWQDRLKAIVLNT